MNDYYIDLPHGRKVLASYALKTTFRKVGRPKNEDYVLTMSEIERDHCRKVIKAKLKKPTPQKQGWFAKFFR